MNVRLRSGGRLLRVLVPALVAATTASALVVAARTEITALAYRVGRLLDSEAALRREVEKLRLEVAALTSPKRIEREARAIGLVDPRPGQVLILPEDGLGQSGEGSGEPTP